MFQRPLLGNQSAPRFTIQIMKMWPETAQLNLVSCYGDRRPKSLLLHTIVRFWREGTWLRKLGRSAISRNAAAAAAIAAAAASRCRAAWSQNCSRYYIQSWKFRQMEVSTAVSFNICTCNEYGTCESANPPIFWTPSTPIPTTTTTPIPGAPCF